LPQATGPAGGRAIRIDRRALLRANRIVPSAVLVRRDRLVRAGAFDADPRLRGCEDWDLWLRLAQDGPVVAVPDVTMGYRLHGASMSGHLAQMNQAARLAMERAVGPEEGDPAGWPEEKRLGWGGAHRFRALTALVRGSDWEGCVAALNQALAADPSLAADADLFYELALGAQPLGYRGTAMNSDLADGVRRIERLLAALASPGDPLRGRQVASSAWRALALAAYNVGHASTARRALGRLARADPGSLAQGPVLRLVLRSTLGWPGVRARRQAGLMP
jgi:hypothetical protein